MSVSDSLLAIDPGVRLHGWCVLARAEGGAWEPVRWGHDESEVVLREIQASDLVVVETPAGYAYSAARVRGLLDAAGAAGEFRGVARASGARAVPCSAETWRAALTGSAHPDDAAIQTALERQALAGRLTRLPTTARKLELSHVLDACGLGLVTGLRGADWVEAREAERRGATTRQAKLPGLGTKRRARR